MIQVQISPALHGMTLPTQVRARVVEAAQRTLAFANAPSLAELTVVVTNDEQLQDLNRNYRDKDATTDVLSFPADEVDPDSGQDYLGDVLISYPQALRQAQNAAHSVDDELCLLTVHGILHLLGYDHANPEQKGEMWALQAKILEALGCSQKIADT